MRYLLFFIILISSPAFSDNSYLLLDKTNTIFDPSIRDHIEFYKDETNKLTAREIQFKNFETLQKYINSPYEPDATYWFKLKISNISTHTLWYLEILDPFIEKINFSEKKDTLFIYKSTGSAERFDTRPLAHKNFLFPISLQKNESTTVYFSYKTPTKNGLRITLRKAENLFEYATNEYYFLGIFYGILLIMALYNLFIYFSTKESIYIFYVLYVITYCINSYRIDGMGFKYIWGNFPEINIFIVSTSRLLLILGFYFYSSKFLSIKQLSQKLNRYLIFSLILYTLLFTINSLLINSHLLDYFYLIPFSLIYVAGILAYKKGNAGAKYFLIALNFFLLCYTIYLLRGEHLIPTSIFTIYSLNFGFLVEVVIFSYGMAQRLRIEQERKEKLQEEHIKQLQENDRLKNDYNKTLEVKIEQRTEELRLKNIELSDTLQVLKEKNLQIENFNKHLEIDNKALSNNIQEINKARFQLKDLTLEEFQKIYPDEEACFKYLADLKWSKGYSCKKCNGVSSYTGKTPHSKRCSKCNYDESATAFTIFHNSKMAVTSSFYLIYLILANKNISSHELSNQLGIRQKTCWAYKKKILERLEAKGASKVTSKDWGKLFTIDTPKL